MRLWPRIKTALATPFLRRVLNRPNPLVIREELACKYLRGDGIEVGAGQAPVRIPDGATVRYVDREPGDGVSFVSSLETLAGIDDASVDFLIANHVLEHMENPLRALLAVVRVLRMDGIAFITLPNSRYSFDKVRPVTALAHVIKDFEEGPEWSRRDHIREFAEKIEGCHGARLDRRVAELEGEPSGVHFHVWDAAAMGQMFGYMARYLMPIFVSQTRGEIHWILRKVAV